MAELRYPNFRQDTTDDNFTVGERVEVYGVSGTIDHIGGFQVRSDASTRIINKRRNDVRDPTSHQTGEQINLRAGSQVEIKMSNNTWVPGTLLIKYYRVILDGREPSMVAHINIRRLTQVVELPPLNAPAPAARPMQMGVEPNPPYRFGENVECLSQDVWVPAVLSGVRTDSLYAVVILNPETGRRNQRPINMVRTLQNQPAINLNVRIGDTVLYEANENRPIGNFIQGIVVDKMYNVAYTMPNGIFIRNDKSTNEIRRRQGQATAQATAQAVPRPPAPPQLGPGGLAFEIHNAFDSFKLENFMNIVRSGNHRNNDSPLQPLIDNINANPNISQVEKVDLTGKIERIFATLRQYSNYENNKDKIIDCIQYVLRQPQEFIDIYIKTFITDCLKAYARGNTQSCIKGMYERVFFSFRDTVSTLCLDQIQGTGAAPLCKPEYIEIFNCFYEDLSTESLNDYAQRWFRERGEAVENFSQEARIQDFIEFMRRELNNNARFMQTERSVIRYAAENINVLFGGKRKTIKRKQRKTIKMKNKHRKSRKNK